MNQPHIRALCINGLLDEISASYPAQLQFENNRTHVCLLVVQAVGLRELEGKSGLMFNSLQQLDIYFLPK